MQIRRFEPRDLPRLLDFLACQYPESLGKSDARYFHWRFAENPLGSSLDDCCLALAGEEIVGQLGTLKDRLWVDGTWHDALWLVDLIVAPEHRGGLAALRLFQSLMHEPRLLLTTGAGPHMAPLYRALGWRKMSIARSCFWPIRPSGLLRIARSSGRAERAARLGRPLAWAADVTLPFVQRQFLRPHRADLQVERHETFDVEIDALVERLLPTLGITGFRSTRLLEWKLDRRPTGAHAIYTARDPASAGELRGYLVAKWMQREGVASWADVVDYLVEPDDLAAFRSLCAALCRDALSRGVDFVRFRLSRPEHLRQLRLPLWLDRTAAASDDVFAYAADAQLLDQLVAQPWHLTALASDRADYGRDDWPADPPA